MRITQLIVTSILFAFAVKALPTLDTGSALGELLAARKAGDDARVVSLRAALVARADQEKKQFQAQWDVAECFRICATDLRTRRQVNYLAGKTAKELKSQQEQWADQGLAYGERAVELASSEAERAAAHRVVGELYACGITGMVSGMKNGPKARNHMEEATRRTPDDPECQRALGTMYLNNPPISGGDVPRAITTFQHCHELLPDNDDYLVLLGMAFQKGQQWDKALAATEKALELNPANRNASALRDRIVAKVGFGE